MHICMANMRVALFPSTRPAGHMNPAVTDSYLKATYPPFDAFSRPFGGGRKDLQDRAPKLGLSFLCPSLCPRRHLPEAELRAI
jgi:hypothetical protein